LGLLGFAEDESAAARAVDRLAAMAGTLRDL
jgi:hypothetical protein